jgi:hypothetical protein
VRNKLRLYSGVVAIVVLAALASSTAVASANSKGKKQTLRLVATQIQSESVDVGTAGPSLGDEFVFSERLTRHGREVGESGVVCTIVQLLPPYEVTTLQCIGTLKLRRGQITLQGLIEVQGMDDPGPFKVAITGGTGAFSGAGGSALVRNVTPTRSIYKLRFDSSKHKKHHHHR